MAAAGRTGSGLVELNAPRKPGLFEDSGDVFQPPGGAPERAERSAVERCRYPPQGEAALRQVADLFQQPVGEVGADVLSV